MLDKLDIVIPLKANPDNESLRYCLRSIAENVPHNRIFVIGGKPEWVTGVIHIPDASGDVSRYARIANSILIAGTIPELTDDFVLFNDDFFALEPIQSIDTNHRGLLRHHIEQLSAGKHSVVYKRSLIATGQLLRANGIANPRSYELHLPMIINKENLRLLELGMIEALGDGPHRMYQWRSLYGNWYKIGGTKTEDVKVYGRIQKTWTQGPIVSTSNLAFRHGKVGEHIQSRFKTKCRFEI